MDTLEHSMVHSSGTIDEEPSHGGSVTITLDSCHSTWSFQPARMRFRRTLKGFGSANVRTSWRPYHGLRFDHAGDSFTVVLNEQGSRRLVSWCHLPGKDRCGNCAAPRDDARATDHARQLVR